MIFLNIGSNSGDRRAHLARAVAALISEPLFAGATMRQSAIVESEPWGYASDAPYLNVGLAIDMPAKPDIPWLHTLLDTIQTIEHHLAATPHRNPDGSYRDRELDIDIIAIDNIVYSDSRLTIPHPRMHMRPFVLRPMAELAPDWRHPILGLSCTEMLDAIKA